jgi:hypothetical protein
MNRIVRGSLLAAICGSWIATAHVASAGEEHHGRRHDRGDLDGIFSVPEFDPAAAGAIAVVVGLGAVIVARRRKP